MKNFIRFIVDFPHNIGLKFHLDLHPQDKNSQKGTDFHGVLEHRREELEDST